VKLRLFPAAIRDLKELRAYIAADDPAASVSVSARLGKAIALIAEKPSIGRPTPQRPIREWAVPGLPYLIPYRIEGDTVEILRVWHTSRERPLEW
jgi:plasmid stabilization system protein ParE